jgi:plastocyanin
MRWTACPFGLVSLLLLVALIGCGGGDTSSVEQSTSAEKKAREETPEAEVEPQAPLPPKSAGHVPPGGRTVTAKVYKHVRKGIPAERNQWMVDIPVDPGGKLRFTVKNVIVPEGNANFRLINPQSVGHDLVIKELGAEKIGVGLEPYKTSVIENGSAWVGATLWADKHFIFYCSVPGHRQAGMEGTITVDPRLDTEDLKPF